MTVSKEIRDSFYSGIKTKGMRFTINDSVKLLGGKHAGELGIVISVEAVAPEFEYLVETTQGKDIVVKQMNLELV